MNRDNKIKYLANIYHLLESDGGVDRVEDKVFEEIAREIEAGYFEKKEAKNLAKTADFQLQRLDRWSDRIRNLEDILFSAYCNGVVDPAEKKLILGCADQLDISQQQFDVVKKETRRRFVEFKKNPIR
ncbi:MAG: hypothetical protein ACC645_00445 [Pirellulales bacterium]